MRAKMQQGRAYQYAVHAESGDAVERVCVSSTRGRCLKRACRTSPDHRVEDAPHGTRFSFVMLPGASSVVHVRLSAGPNRLWHIAALRPVVFHHFEVPVVAAHSSMFVISEIMSVSGFQLVRI